MSRTIKKATVQRLPDQTTQELNEHLHAFLLAYNHAKRLKTLHGFTPHEFVCAQWQRNPTTLPDTRPSLLWDYISKATAE